MRWATVDPESLSATNPAKLRNLVAGKWSDPGAASKIMKITDPLNGGEFVWSPDTQPGAELEPFIASLRGTPKSGLFNPLKNPERYVQWGEICHRAGHELSRPEVERFFSRCIQRVMPKSDLQCKNEVTVTAQFLKSFGGDSVRFMAQDFGVSGDRLGQHSRGYRWPYGPVAIVAPFNFPLEIVALQMIGALLMGNKPCVKPAPKVGLVTEQFFRLLHHCGMPPP